MIDLPRLGFGCAPIGGLFEPVGDQTAESTLEAAWESGIRYFDTAPLYGLGLAEQRLGRFLATKSRDELVVSTKVGRLIREGTSANDVSLAIVAAPRSARAILCIACPVGGDESATPAANRPSSSSTYSLASRMKKPRKPADDAMPAPVVSA